MSLVLLPVGSEELGYFAKRGQVTPGEISPHLPSQCNKLLCPRTPALQRSNLKDGKALFPGCGEGSTVHTVVGIK